jgi:hypothetical protein
MLYPFELRAQIRQLQLHQWVPDNQSYGIRLTEVPAQPQYRTASARLRVEPGRQLGTLEVSWEPVNLNRRPMANKRLC